jgi:asparagine synthase (glutamine-hydrolysing)
VARAISCVFFAPTSLLSYQWIHDFKDGKPMCGILGALNLTNRSPIPAERLHAASGAMRHRGPDDNGAFVQPDFVMAARRLSIIDVSHGHQPMSNETGTVQIVYNGEAYNHEELRAELESLGHRFRTSADTEALLHGYEQWGPDGLVSRLRGMFAFAIWDGPRHSLFLARDRMGIKPLYYVEHDGRFYFASEIRPLLMLSEMPRRLNYPALDVFLRIGFVTSPHTLFEGVRKLPPAHLLCVKDGAYVVRKYWELSYEAAPPRPGQAIIEEFRARLQESIDRHLMSDVALGALLSGGVDSTAVVAFMRNTMRTPFKTVTIGFEEAGLDEAEAAAASARALGTDHHSIRFTGDSMAEYPTVIRFQEEPSARPTHVALYHVFKACREQGLKVVMTGEGGDELLGGYSWHGSGFLDRAISNLPLSLSTAFASSSTLRRLEQSGRTLARALRGVPTRNHRRYLAMIQVGKPEVWRRLLSRDMAEALGERSGQSILESWSDWTSSTEGRPDFEQVLWIQSRTRMPDYINHHLDRMSMAHSVEARPPFLDHTLWEFCASLPTGLKLRRSTEKYLLREAGKHLIPEAARLRPKSPLRVPYQRWVARPRLPEWAEAALSESRLIRTGWFDPMAVLELRREVQSGDLAKATMFMSVLTLQVWHQIFLESPLTDEPRGS